MDDSFFTYLQQLELIAFFSGYPLIYSIIVSIAGKNQSKRSFKNRLVPLLPFAYALAGTLYIGLQLKNMYPDYSIENIKLIFLLSYLKIWGMLSVLFWIPAFSRKPVFSLLHSLIFFFLLVKNLFLYIFGTGYQNNISNEMKIYTDSLILNTICFLLITFFYLIYRQFRPGSSTK